MRGQETSNAAEITALEAVIKPHEGSKHINLLPNLQLLISQENTRKPAIFPQQWMAPDAFTDDDKRKDHADLQDLGDWRTLPEDLSGFRHFYDARRERIVKRLKRLLG